MVIQIKIRMRQLLFVFALLVCGATSFAQPALADTSRLYFHDGKFSWHTSLSTLTTFLSSSATMTEAAQDAVGGILVDGNTINFRYLDNTPQIDADVITQMSIASDVSGLKLSGDATTPGVSKLYGTDASGVKGWYDQPGGGGGGSVATDAIWDAKGDLAVGTGANTAARLAVGTDGKQIYADAAEATGLRWGASVITPAQITSNQNDYNPTGWANAQIVKISGDNGIRAITSFAATFNGDKKTLLNTGSFPLYIPSQHTSGTAANRVIGFCDYIIFPKCAVEIMYDNSDSRWRITSQVPNPQFFNALYYSWSYGSNTTGDLWFMDYGALGTGSSMLSTDAASGYPGHLLINTGTTSSGSGRAAFSKGGLHYAIFGDAHLWAETLISIPTLSTAGDTYHIYFTLDDTGNNNTLSNNSVGIKYSHGVNSGKWQGFSRDNAGTESTVDLGTTVATNTLYKLRVELNKTKTEARFYVNGDMAGLVTGNMPDALSMATRLLLLKSVGTTARTLRFHSMTAAAIFP